MVALVECRRQEGSSKVKPHTPLCALSCTADEGVQFNPVHICRALFSVAPHPPMDYLMHSFEKSYNAKMGEYNSIRPRSQETR